jgi:hypothetical protein
MTSRGTSSGSMPTRSRSRTAARPGGSTWSVALSQHVHYTHWRTKHEGLSSLHLLLQSAQVDLPVEKPLSADELREQVGELVENMAREEAAARTHFVGIYVSGRRLLKASWPAGLLCLPWPFSLRVCPQENRHEEAREARDTLVVDMRHRYEKARRCLACCALPRRSRLCDRCAGRRLLRQGPDASRLLPRHVIVVSSQLRSPEPSAHRSQARDLSVRMSDWMGLNAAVMRDLEQEEAEAQG